VSEAGRACLSSFFFVYLPSRRIYFVFIEGCIPIVFKWEKYPYLLKLFSKLSMCSLNY